MSAADTIEGEVSGRGRRVTIVAARFNDFIVASLLKGARAAWHERGGAAEDLTVVRVPGAWRGEGQGEPLELLEGAGTPILAIIGGRDPYTPPAAK